MMALIVSPGNFEMDTVIGIKYARVIPPYRLMWLKGYKNPSTYAIKVDTFTSGHPVAALSHNYTLM